MGVDAIPETGYRPMHKKGKKNKNPCSPGVYILVRQRQTMKVVSQLCSV